MKDAQRTENAVERASTSGFTDSNFQSPAARCRVLDGLRRQKVGPLAPTLGPNKALQGNSGSGGWHLRGATSSRQSDYPGRLHSLTFLVVAAMYHNLPSRRIPSSLHGYRSTLRLQNSALHGRIRNTTDILQPATNAFQDAPRRISLQYGIRSLY